MPRLKWGIAGSVPGLRALACSSVVVFGSCLSEFGVMAFSICWRRDSVAGLWDGGFLIIHPWAFALCGSSEVVEAMAAGVG